MYSPTDIFDHTAHVGQLGGNDGCVRCHEDPALPRTRETVKGCEQCHGVLGAFKVSPHGPDFDAERAWSRSARTCLACHVRNPLNGGEP